MADNGRHGTVRVAIVAAGIVLSVIRPALAHAETADDAYIRVLDNHNIHYGTRAHGLAMGHAACRALDAGQYDTPEGVVGALRRANGLSYDVAAAVTAAAIVMFCPWDKS